MLVFMHPAVLQTPGSATSEPTVLIVEPDFTGHRQRYVEWAVQALTEAGRRCLVATDGRALGRA